MFDKSCKFEIRNNLLYKLSSQKEFALDSKPTRRLCIPPTMVHSILTTFHTDLVSGGHTGIQRTIDKIAHRYYWPDLHKDVAAFVKACTICAERKSPPRAFQPYTGQMPEVTTPFYRVASDVMGPFPVTSTGLKYIVTFIDCFTRYIELTPTADTTAATLARVYIEKIVLRHGAAKELLTDRAPAYLGKLMSEILAITKTTKLTTSAYHPATNGLVERSHKVVTDFMSSLVKSDQTNWSEIIPYVQNYFNTNFIQSTGFSPHHLLYGHPIMSPTDIDLGFVGPFAYYSSALDYASTFWANILWLRDAASNVQRRSTVRYHNARDQSANPVYYGPDSLVRVYFPHSTPGISPKLRRLWRGPFRVLSENEQNVLVERTNRWLPFSRPTWVHKERTKHSESYIPREPSTDAPAVSSRPPAVSGPELSLPLPSPMVEPPAVSLQSPPASVVIPSDASTVSPPAVSTPLAPERSVHFQRSPIQTRSRTQSSQPTVESSFRPISPVRTRSQARGRVHRPKPK